MPGSTFGSRVRQRCIGLLRRSRVLALLDGIPLPGRSGRRLAAYGRFRQVQQAAGEGDVTRALNLATIEGPLPQNLEQFRCRQQEMLRVLEQGPAVINLPPPRGEAEAGEGPVIFALHNSLPFDGAGYGLRTQMLLHHLSVRGGTFRAVTRPGYPWDLQAHREKPRDPASAVDSVLYRRLDAGPYPYNRVPDSAYVTWYAHQLIRQTGDVRPRAFHGVSNFLNGLAAVSAGRQLDVPAIYEMRGLWHYSRVAREPAFRHSELYAYQDAMERRAAREADAVITISEALKRHLASDWGITEDKIHVVPNAVDTALFRPGQREHGLRDSLRMAGRFTVGFVGSLTDYEGLDDLIHAVAGLDESVGLVIVGDGNARAGLQGLVNELGCGHRICLTGRVPFADVRRYYGCFDLCAYPRRNQEVCRYVPPLKPLEATAVGLPVIVSDLPPMRELVEGCPSAAVCRPGDPASLASSIRVMQDRAGGTDAQVLHAWTDRNRGVDTVVSSLQAVHHAVSGATGGF